jgi:lipopolysaccharide heptosyltransferase II
MRGEAAWGHARRVLCVRLDALGDVLMTTPALRALKTSYPDRQITLLTSPAGAAVARLVPEIDEVLIYEAPWMKATPPRADSRAEVAMIERLRSMSFDAAVVFTVYSQNPLPSAFLCYFAEIPLRLAHCHENPYQILTDWVPDPEPTQFVRHEVRRQLDLMASVGCRTEDERLSLSVPKHSLEAARSLLARRGLRSHRPWVVIHPGASAPSRRYRPEGFAEAARQLVHEHGVQVVFTGSSDEAELVDSIRAMMQGPSITLAGTLGLAELAATIRLAPVLIANNTGPVHIAAAVGTSVVDIYALTNRQHTPWGVAHRVLSHEVPCAPCYKSVCPEGHHDCLRRVPPEAIVQATQELLAACAAARSKRRARSCVPLEEIY